MMIKRIIVGALETNCYLLISGNEMIVIDPGGSWERILNEIKKTDAKPKYIINTHSHFDHTLANKKVKEVTGAQILSNLKEGDEIKIGESVLKVISTPGHTKDSICLLGKNFIFTGDTIFKDGYGRTDLPGGSERDLKKSLAKLKKILKPGITCYPGHGEIFKIVR